MRLSRLSLCRLRTGLLLPRAELDISARGNRPGPGAAAALAAASDDGSVLAAFQDGSKLHGIGVLARVRRLPALNGVDRWRLTGVTRATIEEVVEGEVPKVFAGILPDRAEDALAPPPSFIDAVCELSAEWNAADQWKAAFALLARSPLGQWASTLGTLMPVKGPGRFEALDRPERLQRVLESRLEEMLEMHSRRRIRDAVLRQTIPRISRALSEKTVSVFTGSASWVLFHPDEMEHRAMSPVRWWREKRILGMETAAGNLIAPGLCPGPGTEPPRNEREETVNVPSVRLRVTAGSLTARERRFVAGESEFRLQVRRGRVFVGEPRHLPSAETEAWPREMGNPDAWIDVPNGFYRVRVSALRWLDEEGAIEDGEPASHSLPAFVLQFIPADTLSDIVPPRALPRLGAYEA